MENPTNNRRLDIVIFGVSGLVGKHTVHQAVSMLRELRWGVAGRNIHKLQAVLQEIAETTGEDLSQIPMVIADAENQTSLIRMAQKARIVVNTVDPFRLSGERVVSACLKAGTHYVDVCGEPLFTKVLQLKYDGIARAVGVYVISSCGFVSIAADMGTVFAERLFNGAIRSVESFMVSGVKKSGANTDLAAFNYGSWMSLSLTYQRIEDVPTQKLRERICNHEMLNNFHLMRDVQIKRSAQICFRSWFVALAVGLLGLFVVFLSKFVFGRSLLLRYPRLFSVGNTSRQGPSEGHSYFEMIIEATGRASNTLLSRRPPNRTMMFKVSGPNPGYRSTSVAVLASALTILRESNLMPDHGGVLRPGAAFKRTSLIHKLQKHKDGMDFDMVVWPRKISS